MFARIVNRIDRWGTVILIYLLPWQARLIFREGTLAGATSEPQTFSLYAVEVLIWAMLAVRLAAVMLEKGMVHRSRWYALRSTNRALIAFAAVCLLAFFSVIVSADPPATLFASWRLAEGLAIIFLVMTAPSEREARLAFIVSALVQSAIAIAETIFQRVYPDAWLGMAAHYPEMAGTSVVEAAGMRLLRAYGTLPHPNILGGFLAIAILGVRPLIRRASLIGGAIYFVLGMGLFLTFSRLAWIAVAVGLIVQWLYARRDRVFLRQAPLALVALIVGAVLYWPFVAARTAASGRLEDKSVAARETSYADALKLFSRHSFSGVGAGAFTEALHDEIDPKRSGYDLEPAHSAPLEVLAELGIFGALLYLWFLWLAARLAWKSGRIGLAAALICLAALDHWPWTTYAGIVIFCLGWGFTVRRCCEEGVTHKAGAVIISHDDPEKILLLYRDGEDYSDWTFPKGHMEPGESREDTMAREIREETGLEVEILKFLPDRRYLTVRGKPVAAHFFLARSLDDLKLRIEPCFPGNKLEWVPIKEAESRLTYENMKEYFRGIKNLLG